MERIQKNNTARILTLLLLAATLFSFTGCGGNGSGAGGAIDMDKLALELQNGIEFKDSMSEVDSAVFYSLYGLTKDDADSGVMISSTGATAEEITIIHAASADKMDAVMTAVDSHVQAQRDGFEDYVPGELDKLKNPVIQQIGDYVVLCVSNDNDKAKAIIKQYQ